MAATIGREFGVDVLARVARDVDEDALVGAASTSCGGGGSSASARARRHLRLQPRQDPRGRLPRRQPGPAAAPALRIARGARARSTRSPGVRERAGRRAPRAGRRGRARPSPWYRRAAADAAQLLHADAQAVELLQPGARTCSPRCRAAARPGRASSWSVRTALLRAAGVGRRVLVAGHVGDAQERALELVARRSAVEPAPPLLRSLALTALTRSDFARRPGIRRAAAAAAAEARRRRALVVEAAYVLGIAAFWQADFETARRQFELAVARYRAEDRAHPPDPLRPGPQGVSAWAAGEHAVVPRRAGRRAWPAAGRRSTGPSEVGHPFSRAVGADLRVRCSRWTWAMSRPFGSTPPSLADSAAGAVNAHVVSALRRLRRRARRRHRRRSRRDQGRRRADPRPVRPHPGSTRSWSRLLLAAYLRREDAAAALDAAERLLEMGGAARLWAAEARRVWAELGAAAHRRLRNARGTAPAAAWRPASRTGEASMIEKLREEFDGDLLRPGDDGYDAARSSGTAGIDRRPALIARCRSAADVAAALAPRAARRSGDRRARRRAQLRRRRCAATAADDRPRAR